MVSISSMQYQMFKIRKPGDKESTSADFSCVLPNLPFLASALIGGWQENHHNYIVSLGKLLKMKHSEHVLRTEE